MTKLYRYLSDITKRLGHIPSHIWNDISERCVRSVKENFQQGGRPKKWKKSARAKKGGKTLIDTSRLINSITYQSFGDETRVGTNTIYAAIHNFGGTIKAKNKPFLKFQIDGQWKQVKSVDMPKREFMIIHNDDIEYIEDVVLNYGG